MPKTEEMFATFLIGAVDHGLSLLGGSSQKAIYFHLEKEYSIPIERIPENAEAFVNGLESMFRTGAIVIEKAILTYLYLRLGLEYRENKNSRFVDSLNRARKMWLNQEQTQANCC